MVQKYTKKIMLCLYCCGGLMHKEEIFTNRGDSTLDPKVQLWLDLQSQLCAWVTNLEWIDVFYFQKSFAFNIYSEMIIEHFEVI